MENGGGEGAVYLTVHEVAELLGVSAPTVYRWLRTGQLLGGIRMGPRLWRVRRDLVEAWLAEAHREQRP